MKTRGRESEKPLVRSDAQRQSSTGSSSSKLALLFSLLALALSGFAAYQVWQLQQAAKPADTTQTQTKPEAAKDKSPTATASAPSAVPTEAGKLVQPGLDNKAEVTLLSAERIQDPDTGNSDVVNVKLRIRRLAENVSAYDFINVGGATAQDSGSDIATYEPVDAIRKSTGPISLEGIRKGASVDAYVWLRVPEAVKTLNIRVPETELFQAVKVAK
ncbi:hypothetical protein NDA01_17995 [Trichocoleus desertorum AS-A10]|uniref:hypothetical protein n=1 Tax=Trichocoleus desertorum TaxID=1481672 RepID=UPI003299F233